MTVGDVVATAGVTREAFYAQFRGKGDAFLAVQAFGLERSVSLTAGRFFGSDSWRDRVWGGLEAMLSYVAGQRDLVFVDLVESFAAGPAAIRRSFENRMAYTLFLEDGYRQRLEAEALPRICSEAIAGAIHELMRRQVVAGRTERMLEILPQVVYVTLAPFAGPEAALRLIEERTGRPIPRSPSRRGGG
jgi:AcrR family transcriptional regulator